MKAGLNRGANHPLRLAEPLRCCNRCHEVRESIHFEVIRRDTLNGVCEDCSGLAKKLAATALLHQSRRCCSKCTESRGPSDFYEGTHVCKKCFSAQTKANAAARGREHRNRKYREWYHRDPTKQRAAELRRRARKNGAKRVDLTEEQWRDIVQYYDGRCAYCFGLFSRLEKDHVIPISKGGDHSADNVVPACRSCNASKNARTPEEWLAA